MSSIARLALACFALAALSPAPRPARAATGPGKLAAADLAVLGVSLRPEPVEQVVPLGVPTAVEPRFVAAGGTGETVPVGALPATMRVRADLSGPGLPRPLALECRPGESLGIPALPVEGTHRLENLRLVDGDELVLLAEPSIATLEVRSILVAGVSSRPLTPEELIERGIVIDADSFQAVNFSVELAVESGEIALDFPALLPLDGGPAVLLPPLSLPDDVGPTAERPEPARTPDVFVSGFVPEVEVAGEPAPVSVAGALVFPHAVGFLNQFHSVLLLVTNAAPESSPLALADLEASFTLPAGKLRRARTAPPTGATDPVPVRMPGPDGRLGTGDDLAVLAAARTGSAELVVEGLAEGLHRVDVAIAGKVTGLPQGEARLTGSATGTVLVRNPRFNLTFVLPGVVAAGEALTYAVTLTNTGDVPAYLASLRLPAAALAGAVLEAGESEIRSFDAIAPGESASASWKLRALRTGRVSGARLVDAAANLEGRFELRLAVGDDGIPLSPDVVTLPAAAWKLPRPLVEALLDFVGSAWSNATAPAGTLPAGMPLVATGAVRRLAAQIADAGQRLELGEPLAEVLGHLALRLAGAEGRDPALDALRRVSSRWPAAAAALAAELEHASPGAGAADLASAIGQAHFYAAPFLLAGLDTTQGGPLDLVLEDGERRRAGGHPVERALPGGELLALGGGGQLGIAADPHGRMRVRVLARGDGGAALALVVPREVRLGQRRLEIVRFPTLALAAGEEAWIDLDEHDPTFVLETPSGPLAGVSTPVVAPPLRLLSARVAAEREPGHHLVAARFNRPVDEASALADRFLLSGPAAERQRVIDLRFQAHGRFVLLSLLNPVPPSPPTTLAATGLRDREGGGLDPASLAVPIEAPSPRDGWGTVTGVVRDGDGQPLSGLRVVLSETRPTTAGNGHALVPQAEAATDASGRYRFWFARRTGRVLEVAALHPRSGERAAALATLRADGEALELPLGFIGRGSAAGRVIDDKANPLSRVLVTARSELVRSFVQTWTDAEGRFRLDGLTVGPSNLSFQDRAGRSAARSVAVSTPGEVVDLGDVVVLDLRRGTVRGRVSAGGVAVAAAPVIVRSNGTSPAWGTWKKTDADGRFEFVGVPEGDIALEALDPADWSWVRARAGGRLSAGEARTFDLRWVAGSGTVAGQVLDAWGRPAGGVLVQLDGRAPVAPGADGRFAFAGVALGDGTVRARAPSGPANEVSASYSLRYDGQRVEVVLRQPGAGTIRVRTVQGAVPLAGAKVVLRGTGRACTTDPLGRCDFLDVVPGRYILDATWKASGAPASTVPEAGNAEAVVRFHQDVADVVVDLPARVSLSGTTREGGASPRPLGGARVVLYSLELDADGRLAFAETARTTSDFDGRFAFPGVRQGPFLLEATSPLLATRASFGATLSAPRQVELDFPPPGATHALTVHVTMPDGIATPADPALLAITVTRIDPPAPALEGRGQDAVFAVAGRVGIEVSYLEGGLEYVAAAGRSVGQDTTHELRLLGFGDVYGTVRDGDGRPVAGAAVRLRSLALPERVVERAGTTGPDGTFRFDGVREGPITLVAESPAPGGGAAVASGSLGHQGELRLEPRFAPAALLDAVVLREDGRTPASGVPVALRTRGYLGHYEIADAGVTDAAGKVRLGPVPYDPVAGSEARVFALDPPTGRFAARAVVLAAREQSAVLVLGARGAVHGFALDSDGATPLGDATVRLEQGPTAEEMPGLSLLASTDPATGRFRFEGVAAGSFTCRASKRLSTLEARGDAEVLGEGHLARVDLVLEPHGVVAGRVRRDGQPVPGATVRLWHAGVLAAGGRVTSTEADPARGLGAFRFDDVPLGPFRIAAEAVEGDRVEAEGRIDAGGELATADLDLPGFADLEVVIRQGTKVVSEPGWTVRLESPISDQQANPALFRLVPRGPVVVRAENASRTAEGAASTVIAPGVSRATVEVQVGQVQRVAGTVLLPDRSGPAAAARVEVRSAGFRAILPAGPDGSFAFEHVPASAGAALVVEAWEPAGIGRARRRLTWASPPADAFVELLLDRTPPVLLASRPEDGADDVPIEPSRLELDFSEELDSASLAAAIALACDGRAVPARPAVQGARLDIDVPVALPGDAGCTLLLGAAVEDASGVPLGTDLAVQFRTRDDRPPRAALDHPADGAVAVPIATAVRLAFSEPMALSSLPAAITVTRNGLPVPAGVVPSPDGLLATLGLALEADSSYAVGVSAAAHDPAGNPAVPATFGFTTADTIPPALAAIGVAPAAPAYPEGRTLTVTARPAAGSDDIERVDYFADGVWQAAGSPPEFAAAVVVPSRADAGDDFTLEAVARDDAGNPSPPLTRTIAISADLPPAVAVVLPAEGAAVDRGQRIAVEVRASDDAGLRSVSWSAAGIPGARGEVAPPADHMQETLRGEFAAPADPTVTEVWIDASATDSAGNTTVAARRRVAIVDTAFAGRVAYGDGRPAPGVEVEVHGSRGTFRAVSDARPGQEGRFRVAVPAGGHDGIELFEPSSGRRARRSAIVAAPGVATDLGEIRLSGAGSVRGIARLQGLPHPGAEITASGPWGTQKVVSGSDGRFLLERMAEGDWALAGKSAAGLTSRQVTVSAAGDGFDVEAAPVDLPAPRIRSLTPPTGTPNLEQDVTLSGENFAIGAVVTVDGQPVTVVWRNSTYALTVRVPPHAAGLAGIVVRNPDGGTASATFAYDARDLGLLLAGTADDIVRAGAAVAVAGAGGLHAFVDSGGGLAKAGFLAGSWTRLAASGSLVFALRRNGLDLVDLADPAAPVLSGSSPLADSPAREIVAGEGQALVLSGNEVLRFAATGDGKLVALASFFVGLEPADGQLAGDRLYLAVPSQDKFPGGVRVFDVSDPAAPALLGEVTGDYVALAVEGTRVLAVARGGPQGRCLARSIDFTSPGAPLLAGESILPGSCARPAVRLAGGRAYLGGCSTGSNVEVVDTADAALLDHERLSTVDGAPGRSLVHGTTLLVATGHAGVRKLALLAEPLSPAPLALSRWAAPTAGGTRFAVFGRDFLPGARVFLGPNEASDVAVGDGVLVATAAPSPAGPALDVRVENPDGRSGTLPAAFAYTDAPRLFAIRPAEDAPQGGRLLRLDGIHLENAPSIEIGDTSVAIENGASAIAPALATGTQADAALGPDRLVAAFRSVPYRHDLERTGPLPSPISEVAVARAADGSWNVAATDRAKVWWFRQRPDGGVTGFGQVALGAWDLAWAGDILFAPASGGTYVIEPFAGGGPRTLAVWRDTVFGDTLAPNELAVSGRRLLANGSGCVFDIADPASPRRLGCLAHDLQTFAFDGRRIAEYDGKAGRLLLHDVASPAAPDLAASVPFPHYGVALAISGDVVFAAAEDGVWSLDLAAPGGPALHGPFAFEPGFEAPSWPSPPVVFADALWTAVRAAGGGAALQRFRIDGPDALVADGTAAARLGPDGPEISSVRAHGPFTILAWQWRKAWLWEAPGSGATPSLASLVPDSTHRDGGTVIEIRGEGFVPGARVWINAAEIDTVAYVDSRRLRALVPAWSGPSPVTVVVRNPGSGPSNGLPLSFPAAAPPSLAEVSPGDGPTSGGTVVRLRGAGLARATAVRFLQGQAEAAASFTVAGLELVVTVPPAPSAAPGPADLEVDTDTATARLDHGFLYEPEVVLAGKFGRGTIAACDGVLYHSVWKSPSYTIRSFDLESPGAPLVAEWTSPSPVLACSLGLGFGERVYDRHGALAATVSGWKYTGAAARGARVIAWNRSGGQAAVFDLALLLASPLVPAFTFDAGTCWFSFDLVAGVADETLAWLDGCGSFSRLFDLSAAPAVELATLPTWPAVGVDRDVAVGLVQGGLGVYDLSDPSLPALSSVLVPDLGTYRLTGSLAADLLLIGKSGFVEAWSRPSRLGFQHLGRFATGVGFQQLALWGGLVILDEGPTVLRLAPAPPAVALTRLSPGSGPVSGGTRVFLTGAGFDGSETVRFDGIPADEVRRISPALLVVSAPPHAAGTVEVRIERGAESASLPAAYEYRAAHRARWLAPHSAPFAGASLRLVLDAEAASLTATLAGIPATVSAEGKARYRLDFPRIDALGPAPLAASAGAAPVELPADSIELLPVELDLGQGAAMDLALDHTGHTIVSGESPSATLVDVRDPARLSRLGQVRGGWSSTPGGLVLDHDLALLPEGGGTWAGELKSGARRALVRGGRLRASRATAIEIAGDRVWAAETSSLLRLDLTGLPAPALSLPAPAPPERTRAGTFLRLEWRDENLFATPENGPSSLVRLDALDLAAPPAAELPRSDDHFIEAMLLSGGTLHAFSSRLGTAGVTYRIDRYEPQTLAPLVGVDLPDDSAEWFDRLYASGRRLVRQGDVLWLASGPRLLAVDLTDETAPARAPALDIPAKGWVTAATARDGVLLTLEDYRWLRGYPLGDRTVGLLALAPAAGPADGWVTLDGWGFDDRSTVSFGGEPARDVRVVGPNRIVCRPPAGPAGTLAVTVAAGPYLSGALDFARE